MDKRKSFTIVIPTYNRPYYLQRILQYYDQSHDYNIIVVDSSSDENKVKNKRIVAACKSIAIDHHNDYSPAIGLYEKINDSLQMVQTEFCTICADDDFITLDGMRQAADFLDSHDDYAVAQGYYISFWVNSEIGNKKQFHWQTRYASWSNTSHSPKERLRRHLSCYWTPTFYGVHRTKLLRMIFQESVKRANDLRFGEMLPTMLTAIYGKIKYLDVFYAARDLSCPGSARQSFEDYVKEDTYDQKYNLFKSCLADHLEMVQGVPRSQAEKIIDESMSVFRMEHKTIGCAVKEKTKNLFECHSFFKNFTKVIKNIYRTIFIPWKVRLDKFSSVLNIPSSKYYNDFNKIRQHVLFFADKMGQQNG